MTRITRDAWQAADTQQRQTWANEVLEQLPEGFERDDPNDRGMARFSINGRYFVLVPGGPARLGFDASSFEPSPQVAHHWGLMAEHYPDLYGAYTLQGYLEHVTSPAREVEMPAIVVEVGAREKGWRYADQDTARRLISGMAWRPGLVQESFSSDGNSRITAHRDEGYFIVEQSVPIRHAEVVEEVAAQGLSLLTPDAWEYVVGGGTGDLFRWGNDCPVHTYPDDIRGDAFPPVTDLNAFGLMVTANNTYRRELTTEPTLKLGGDGGNRVCASLPFFDCWLILATAFRERTYPANDDAYRTWLRRCIEVT